MNNLELSEDAIKFRREYHQGWREKNKERVRQYNSQYWERKALEKKLNRTIRSSKDE